MKNKWLGSKVLVIGAARQGLAISRFLSSHGSIVTLNDGRSESELLTEKEQLRNLSINWVLGNHPLSLLEECDVICVSGGVPLDLPLLVEANNRHIPFTNDSQIFMELVKAPVIGITGSSGKTTTTALIGDIAKKAARQNQKVWVGGNIGNPLINQVSEISSQDIVILELSSFQLELMTKSPNIAAITNITPNHLDRHGTLEAYTAAKANILTHQTPDDIAILNRDDPGAFNLLPLVKGKILTIGYSPLSENQEGIFIKNDMIWSSKIDKAYPICSIKDIPIEGKHNVYNTMIACAISETVGFDPKSIEKAIREFKGVSHRLQLVTTRNGVQWFDDSIATAPERTIAAIEAFNQPIVLLLGGKDKNLPWEKLLQLVNQKVDHVVLFGHAGPIIKKYIEDMKFDQLNFSLDICEDLQEAIQVANQISEPGDVVLLSPGGTSYDEFKDFEERGEKFKQWVLQLQ